MFGDVIVNISGIPILGTEPDLVQLYSMKSGVRRIFESAGVTCAPGEYDVYSMQQVGRPMFYLHSTCYILVT